MSNQCSNISIGRTVEILWSEKDVEGTSWKRDWYRGDVRDYDEENDILDGYCFKDHTVYSSNSKRNWYNFA